MSVAPTAGPFDTIPSSASLPAPPRQFQRPEGRGLSNLTQQNSRRPPAVLLLFCFPDQEGNQEPHRQIGVMAAPAEEPT